MGERYLIDSNPIIDFYNGKLPVEGKNLLSSISPEISIVTNIELFATKDISEEEYLLLKKFVAIAVVHPVNTALVQSTIEIRQNYKIKLPDAIIAATALTFGLTLISRNGKDFENIAGLKLIDPHRL
jgi:predicted nucleic acid-binding protein